MQPASHPYDADHRHDAERSAYLARLQSSFEATAIDGHLFTTASTGLFEVYLSGFPEGPKRQLRNCQTCRRFIEGFGGLVVIDEEGKQQSPFWIVEDAPEIYQPSIKALATTVNRSPVTGVFYSSAGAWGRRIAGGWEHLAVIPPPSHTHRKATMTAFQSMAEKREDHAILLRSLAEFDVKIVSKAVTLLKTDALYRSEKVLGVAMWLADLHKQTKNFRGQALENLRWRAVARAPSGLCHVRSSMIGTLLGDLASGLSFKDVSDRFAAKMHPLRYMRPQVPPSAGNIADAERIVAQMGIARSLLRRYARLDEVRSIWRPKRSETARLSQHAMMTAAGPSLGVFEHLRPKGDAAALPMAPPTVLTFEKFKRIVLPTADRIDYRTSAGRVSFGGLVTAQDADAPPILRWDREDARNPFSWYVYNGGSTAENWTMTSDALVPVTAIALDPSSWNGGKDADHGGGVIFVLEGANKDRRAEDLGAVLFPETLKAELHPVRATIEAFSRASKMGGIDEASANGLILPVKGSWLHNVFRVFSGDEVVDYTLDRWD